MRPCGAKTCSIVQCDEPNRFDAPRAAYVHVPFCRHRCGYCNFTLLAGRDDLIDDYLRAIELELQQLGQPHEVDTLYFGGGTPTHLSPEQLRRLAIWLCAGIRSRPDMSGPWKRIPPTSTRQWSIR